MGERKKELLVFTYKDLLIIDGQKTELKSLNQLGNLGNWFQYWHLADIYKEDKKNFGFRLKLTDLENCLINTPKILLQWYSQDENVKEYMIKWALNFNTEIELEK